MRILIIGGTSFAGRHIAERAVAQGHAVTLFNRGKTNPGIVPGVDHIEGDRGEGAEGLAGLSGREWDATIDICGYVPKNVRSLLEVLGDGAGNYTFISSISVYPESTEPGFDETAALLAPSYAEELAIEEYGALKVGCELTALEVHGADRVCLVRPGYIVGPYDPTGRFPYWVERVARAGGGRMLGPDADQPMQVIDGRDLAALVVRLVEGGVTGAFNAAAPEPALRFDELLGEIAAGLGVAEPEVVWRGPNELLPLSDAAGSWGLMVADLTKARAHGLSWRPVSETARDTYAWISSARAEGTYVDRGGTMTAEQEAETLAG